MNDIFNKFTSHYKKSIVEAYGLSLVQNKKNIGIEEIFWALIRQKGSLGYETLVKAGLNKITGSKVKIKNIKIEMHQLFESQKQVHLSKEVSSIIVESVAIASKYGHNYVGTEHLLYSLIKINNNKINNILNKYKINKVELLKNMEIILNSTSKFSDMTKAVGSINEKIKQDRKNNKKHGETLLDFFGTELTDEEIQKNINPVIGRKDEINKVVQILSRKDKNNPILLGEPGVGKTAIAEGLAKKIVEGDVIETLLNKRIYALDMPMLVAGTSYRGEFEARIKQLVDEVKQDKNIILFIDEIHNIMGAGSATGTMDAANILKPALARGEIRCIGATTYNDYKKYIEPDSALARRLQKVTVKEPTAEEAIEILKGVKQIYEKHHLVIIEDEAIKEAVELSTRYITDQFLPDKAIDLIDEAGSKKRINKPKNKNSEQIVKLGKELKKIAIQKNNLMSKGEYNKALRLKSAEIEIVNQIYKIEEQELRNKIKEDTGENGIDQITAQDIRELVQESTKIKIVDDRGVENIAKQLERELKQKIIGQNEAIKELINNLKRSIAGLSGEKRPLGSFIFAGPSGVGKTYMAKVLAQAISPNQNSLIKLDMSEFGDKFNATKIIGAPAGYVGYTEGGQLTEKVKRNPHSIILLDEIEKAHSDIFNLFLQILEDGYLTDGQGKKINFKNTIIIMTTNLGLTKNNENNIMGFEEANREKQLNIFKEKLAEWMRLELLNRIDQILVFNRLNSNDLIRIINLELTSIKKTLHNKKIIMNWDKSVAHYLVQSCIDEDKGARVIRDVVREEIENKLADIILDNKQKIKTINIKTNHGKLVFK